VHLQTDAVPQAVAEGALRADALAHDVARDAVDLGGAHPGSHRLQRGLLRRLHQCQRLLLFRVGRFRHDEAAGDVAGIAAVGRAEVHDHEIAALDDPVAGPGVR
jgi:hypothetical protein